tara:strand:+ start:76 stop:456 length:381 start_codon:yes stop_codon:yes gene_type:complete
MSDNKKIPKELKIFTVLMNLEGSIQLWRSGIQAFEMSKGRKKDYFGSSIKYHKDKIELLATYLNIKGSVEEIASSKIPVIKGLLHYPPYLEYLKESGEKEREEREEWEEREECDNRREKYRHPYYI